MCIYKYVTIHFPTDSMYEINECFNHMSNEFNSTKKQLFPELIIELFD